MAKRKETSNDTNETANQKRAQRRMKGEGSVYQRKSDGRWVGSFKVEETGKYQYVYADVTNNTKRAALDKLKRAQREQEQGRLATGPKQKLKDYLEDWFENVHKPTIYITSYARYRTHVYAHIIPGLGHIELRKLTAQRVQQFYADEGKSLSASSVRGMHNILHSALDNAVKWKLISQNVCDQVTLPKIQKRKSQILTKAQILKLVEVANAHEEMGPFIKLGLMSGMRHGEMLSLRWVDIDFQTNILQVKRNVTYGGMKGYGFIEGDPKTEDGTRKIILPQFVSDSLQVHKERQQVQRERMGNKWKDKDLVFCTRTGGYVNSRCSLDRFRRVLKEAGLPETMRVHDLRHNVATFLINVLKYPPTMVQALLGHSDIAITLGMYVETDPETLREMMNDLNDLFGGD